jgi:hypothetical protein
VNHISLAILDTQTLTADLLRTYPLLSTKLQAALNCDASRAEAALGEAVRFLCLIAAHPNTRLTPSHRVDLAWHEFILFTKAYREFCEQHFGRFVDHHPGGSDGQNRRHYRLALYLYAQHFGTPDPEFWDHATQGAQCGECESALTGPPTPH